MKLLTQLRRFHLRVRWFFVLRQYALHDNYLPLHLMYESSYPDKEVGVKYTTLISSTDALLFIIGGSFTTMTKVKTLIIK